MAFPTTVVSLQFGNFGRGPFLSSAGNVYAVADNGGVYKATDPTSSFSLAAQNASIDPVCLDAYQLGDVLYIAEWRTTNTLYLHEFSMSSDSFTTSNQTIVSSGVPTSGNYRQLRVAVRSDGDVIVLYQDGSGSTPDNIDYARREGGSWTTGIQVGNGGFFADTYPVIVKSAGGDTMHFFWRTLTVNNMSCRSLSSTNSLSSVQTGSRSFPNSTFAAKGGTTYVGTNNPFFVAGSNGGSTPFIVQMQESSGNAAFSTPNNSLLSNQAVDDGSPTISLVGHDGDDEIHALLIPGGDDDVDYTISTNAGSSWSTPTTLQTGTFTYVSARRYTRGSQDVIGYLFSSSTTTFYDEIVLAELGAEILPTGIATAEAFGTASLVVTQQVQPTAIASAEAFGAATIQAEQFVTANAITSLEAFGTSSLRISLTSVGVVTQEAFGNTSITTQVDVLANGITSAEAFGVAQIQAVVSVIATGITSQETFGVSQLNRNVSATAINSGEAFGAATVNPGVVQVTATGITSQEAFGSPTLNLNVIANAIASGEVIGDSVVNLGEAQIVAIAIASLEAFGTTSVNPGAVDVLANSIPTQEAFGTASLDHRLGVTGIVTAEAFGSQTVETLATVQAVSIPTAEAFGTASLQPRIEAIAIGSEEVVSQPALAATFEITTAGISSAEAFGSSELSLEVTTISIPSVEAFGLAQVETLNTITANGIPSSEAFGTPVLDTSAVSLLVNAITSQETFGVTNIMSVLILRPDGLPSGAGFGLSSIQTAATIAPAGVVTSQEFGVHNVGFNLEPSGINSSETFGLISDIRFGMTTMSIGSSEQFGRAFIRAAVTPRPLIITSHIV